MTARVLLKGALAPLEWDGVNLYFAVGDGVLQLVDDAVTIAIFPLADVARAEKTAPTKGDALV